MEFFIAKKIQEDDHWKSLNIIFSSSNVPGEGEHKILSYIRYYIYILCINYRKKIFKNLILYNNALFNIIILNLK